MGVLVACGTNAKAIKIQLDTATLNSHKNNNTESNVVLMTFHAAAKLQLTSSCVVQS